MVANEVPVFFPCTGEQLLGICHLPETDGSTGVVIVVGGPQYRVGSHRQFVLLARFLADHGISVFRFDYRGMGDSSGNTVIFEQISQDIKSAIDVFCTQVPRLNNIVLWGLCDAASAIMMYASLKDPRVVGQILLNPWVRTEEGIAKVYLKNYYLKRLLDKELWQKVVHGRFDFREAWSNLVAVCNSAFLKKKSTDDSKQRHYTEQMLQGMEGYAGKSLFILSGNDLTADEFRQHVANSIRWQAILDCDRIRKSTLPEANHTFSKAAWRNEVAEWCMEWINEL